MIIDLKYHRNRISPFKITEIKPNQIFVFGSNLSGIHGKGAAKMGLKWGAKWGKGIGFNGNTYAIPTKSKNIKRTLNLEEIKPFVEDFVNFAKDRKELEFLVTEIGCGLAGHRPIDIAPLFVEAKNLKNVKLPKRFWEVIQ